MIKYSSKEFEKIRKHWFPNLYFVENEKTIKGELDFHARYVNVGYNGIDNWDIESCDRNEDDCIKDVYSIEIDFNKSDLNRYPIVLETDERIKKLADSLGKSINDLHLSGDGSCCLGIFSLYENLSLDSFVLEKVYPYFVWQAYFSKYEKIPPCGECSHNWQKAIDSLIKDEQNNLNLLPSTGKDMPADNNRNKPCSCGSGKKYKKCCLNANTKTNSKRNLIERRLLHLNERKTERVTK